MKPPGGRNRERTTAKLASRTTDRELEFEAARRRNGPNGEVEGRNVLVIDDEIDTAGTITEAVRILRDRGAKEAIIAGYHGLFTGPAIDRLRAADVREIVVTDSIPIADEKRLPNMTILPVAPLLGDAIGRIHSGQSVGALFQ